MTPEDREKAELAMATYGTVIRRKSDGHILSVDEMKSLNLIT